MKFCEDRKLTGTCFFDILIERVHVKGEVICPLLLTPLPDLTISP